MTRSSLADIPAYIMEFEEPIAKESSKNKKELFREAISKNDKETQSERAGQNKLKREVQLLL